LLFLIAPLTTYVA